MQEWIKSYPDYMDWNAKIDPAPIYDILDETAKNFPTAPAFNFLGKKLISEFCEGI